MIGTRLDQSVARESAVPQQLLGIVKRYDVIGATVQNDGSGLHDLNGSKPAPGRAQQNQPHRNPPEVHRHCTTAAGTDYDIGLLLIEFALSNTKSLFKVIVRQ